MTRTPHALSLCLALAAAGSAGAALPGPELSPLASPADRSWPQTLFRTACSPVFCDLEKDGTKEVIAGDDDAVWVFDSAGGLLPGWPVHVGGVNAQVATGDMNGDGLPEIAVCSMSPRPRLWVFEADGVVMQGWPVDLPFHTLLTASCPVIVDLDGDHVADVGVVSEDGISFFDNDGTPLDGWPYLWPIAINNPQWSCPAVGDIDADGSLDVAVGNANAPSWGMHVVGANGVALPGWPQATFGPINSSPALADLDGDGRLEIVAQEGDPGSVGGNLYVWSWDGQFLPGWPLEFADNGWSSRCSPAIADMDNNGTLEIVTLTGDAQMHILKPDASYLTDYPRGIPAVQPISSPSIIDVDGDGSQEIFLSYLSSFSQWVTGWNLDGTTLPGFPQELLAGTDKIALSGVHIDDAQGDGHLDLTVSASAMYTGRLWVIPINPSTWGANTRADWPKMRRDAANLGCLRTGDPASAPGIASFGKTGWRVTPNPLPRGGVVTLAPAAGHALPRGSLAMTDAGGRVLGRLALSGEAAVTLPAAQLFGGRAPAAGVYFMRWQPEVGGTAGVTRLVVAGR